MRVKKDFDLYIDLIDRCNLRCPSCPRGNSTHVAQEKGRMTPERLNRIMKKATDECNVRSVHLYNWTEPFLHPDLAGMIRIVQSYGVNCGLSSNLNILPKIDDVTSTNPEYLLISTSGFTQQVYERAHRGGDIERVKKNMAELSESIKRTGSSIRVEVKYLIYLGNADEAVTMREYADSLGFRFILSYAGLMPIEKLLAYLSDNTIGEPLTEEDRALAGTLVFPHKEVVKLAEPYKKLPCLLQEEWLMINALGKVQLCCMVFDESKYTIADYLATPLSKIQELKMNHWQCPDCFSYGIAAARSWPIRNLNRAILDKFSEYYARMGLDYRKLEGISPLKLWLKSYYMIYRVRASRVRALRRTYRFIRGR